MLGFKYYLLFNNNIKKIKFILGTSLHDKKTIEGKSNERYIRFFKILIYSCEILGLIVKFFL